MLVFFVTANDSPVERQDHQHMATKIWEIFSVLVYDDHAIFIIAIDVLFMPCIYLVLLEGF
jgi:hypothetical protein